MTLEPEDPQLQLMREAFASVRGDEPAHQLARASILAGVRDNPTLYAAALREIAYPQAELDLHLLEGEDAAEQHTARADWFGRFVTRMSLAVNEVSKSMTRKQRLTPGLRILAPSPGSVRVVLRAPLAPSHGAGIEGADDSTVETLALRLVTGMLAMVEDDVPTEDSALTATIQGLSANARLRMRGVAKSVIQSDWQIEGSLSQRGVTQQRIRVDKRAAQRLYTELTRESVERTEQTLRGFIDGQRRSLSTMWFIPDGQKRPIEVAVLDADLLAEVARLSADPTTRVECRLAEFFTVPEGTSEATRRSYELLRIARVEPEPSLL